MAVEARSTVARTAAMTFAAARNCVALRTPPQGEPLGTYNKSIRESQRVKGLRSIRGLLLMEEILHHLKSLKS